MKNVHEIRSLIKFNETHNVEFKSKFESDKVGQALCAFTNDWPNIQEGILLIGVKDKTGSIVGFEEDQDEVQRAISDLCRTAIYPTIAPMIYIVVLEKPIIVVEVKAGTNLPSRYKNDSYIRIGTTTRKTSFYEGLELYNRNKEKSSARTLTDKLPHREQPAKFVGRQKELNELWQWLKDPRLFRCSLAGDGGKGKTATAYEFACRIAEARPEPYDLVLWASAKRKQFVNGKTVPIPSPDFKDLSSLLTKILNDIGFPEDTSLPLKQKEDRVLELLKAFPALIIIDDLDSLDWSSDVETMEFITFHIPRVNSKVLITTRRQIPSIPTVFIGGFSGNEGVQFLDSRLQIAGMKESILSQQQKESILQATDSSALYIEDLVRLFLTIGDIDETINQWSSRTGDEARGYALRREFEMLSKDAKIAILAFALLDEPATSTEAKELAGLTWPKWNDAVSELHRLFLIPRPGIVEGLPRYAINSNTKSLIFSIMEEDSDLSRLKKALQAIRGDSYRNTERSKSVGICINQAGAFIRVGEYETAEKTIKSGLNKLPEDPDLIGALGWVYKCCVPQRITDAREKFRRASDLKCKSSEMYRHWYEMEERKENWNESAEAAEKALEVFPKNQLWSYRLGYSLCRHGQVLVKQMQPRARVYLGRAQKTLLTLLTQLERSTSNVELDLKTYSIFVSNVATLYSISRNEKEKYLDYFAEVVNTWIARHGENPSVDYESQLLIAKFPELKEKITSY